ncbi:hypothetical protein DL990_17380 [Amycolatopsis sp. WAC 01416]|uniref:hypothetical protein n=1 Tax=Amycolatopsis sp. WAC 01416 TaxID=2203196 RepID=UPI000F781F4F|nr:hypothetical protein [Amycolatopsis sp. WAC 01416]RSN31739.1 hypothetical protein DL990_17380 [Amycolatopsis sp. WAC 01416]
MKLPTLDDYQTAIQVPGHTLLDPVLHAGKVEINSQSMPSVVSGGFALTYSITAGSRRFAVRCFHKPGNRLDERYAHISRFIRGRPDLRFLIDVDYVAEGILVNGRRLPIVRMPWVTGTRLNYWIEDNLDTTGALEKVRRAIASATESMSQAGIAHGDLQHGNILVEPTGKISLVDYDGMFLPELRPLGTIESGHRNYQHPERVEDYNSSLDIFSAFAIDLAIDALKLNKTLWAKFSNGENILFTSDDFAFPDSSDLLARLEQMSPLADRARRLRIACAASLADVPTILAGQASTTTRSGRVTPRQVRRALSIDALDTATLFAHQGDEASVFGQITYIKVLKTRYGQRMTLINIGDYNNSGFIIVAFEKATNELIAKFGPDLKKIWKANVSLTGLLTKYQNPNRKKPNPQIEMQRAASLQILSSDQLRALKTSATEATAPPPVKPRHPAQSAPKIQPRRAMSVDERIDSFFAPKYTGHKNLSSPPKQAPPPPANPSPAPIPARRVTPTPPTPPLPPPQPPLWAPPPTQRRPSLAERISAWWRNL